MKLSAASLLYIRYSRRDMFASLQRLGIPYVDLWDTPFGSHISVADEDPQEVLRDLAEFGLRPSAISLYSADPAMMRDGIVFAARIDAPIVIAGHCGSNREQYAAFLQPLTEEARKHGVAVGVENHVDTPVDSIDALCAVAEQVPDFTICLAPPHCVIMGENVPQNITRIRNQMGMFYLWDVPWESTGFTWFRRHWNHFPEEQIPGKGKLTAQYPALMDTLKAVKFDGFINFIAHGGRDWTIEQIERHLQESSQFLE